MSDSDFERLFGGPFEEPFDEELARWIERVGAGVPFPPRDDAELDALLELARDDAQLPPGFGVRLRARLDLARELGPDLDALLDADREGPRAPEGLGRRVLTRLRERSGDAQLDALLDELPDEQPPAGLSARVLRATRAESHRGAAMGLRRWIKPAALAAAALAVVLGVRGMQEQGGEARIEPDAGATAALELSPEDAELLQHFELLEDWEDVTDPELLLGGLGTFESWLLAESDDAALLGAEGDDR